MTGRTLRLLTAALCAGALAGCFEDRARPMPAEPAVEARLSVLLTEPRSGTTVPTGQDVTVTVAGRDLQAASLLGVGFTARRAGASDGAIDSAAVHFAARSDSTHTFTFRVPGTLATGTQLQVQGIAFGPGTQRRLSAVSMLLVVRCVNGVCQ